MKLLLIIAIIRAAGEIVGDYVLKRLKNDRKPIAFRPNPKTCSPDIWEHYENERIRKNILNRFLSNKKTTPGKS